MAAHKSGNQSDLIYTQHCSTDHVRFTSLHSSDHFLLTLNFNIVPDKTHTRPHVTFSCNLLLTLLAMCYGSSSLPSLNQFSSLDANSATDALCCTLMSCLDTVSPLSSKPALTTPSTPWLSNVLNEHRFKLRAAETL